VGSDGVCGGSRTWSASRKRLGVARFIWRRCARLVRIRTCDDILSSAQLFGVAQNAIIVALKKPQLT
jgi:hypothetical protein